MREDIPVHEKELLKILRETTKHPESKMLGPEDRYRFGRFIRSKLPRSQDYHPWLFLACVWFYKLCLLSVELRRVTEKSDLKTISKHRERIAGLRFAIQYGRYANEDERNWALYKIRKLKLNCFDAPILIWSRTLHLKERAIYFGHWNWISGIVQLMPVYVLALVGVSVALCCNLSPFEKIIQISSTLAAMFLLYKFTEAHSLNVYRIGSKYFQSYGFGIKPIPI